MFLGWIPCRLWTCRQLHECESCKSMSCSAAWSAGWVWCARSPRRRCSGARACRSASCTSRRVGWTRWRGMSWARSSWTLLAISTMTECERWISLAYWTFIFVYLEGALFLLLCFREAICLRINWETYKSKLFCF